MGETNNLTFGHGNCHFRDQYLFSHDHLADDNRIVSNSGDTILNSTVIRGHHASIVLTRQVLFLTTALSFVESSRLVPSYLHHGTQRNVQSMGPIFIRRDLNIEHREIHGSRRRKKNDIMSPEIKKPNPGATMENIRIRNAEPSDYQPIISVINEWWGGRSMADMLPKLFFVHFRQTSFVAEHGDDIVGFLIGFTSQTFPDERTSILLVYILKIGRKVSGETLYNRFFEKAKAFGCSRVRCVTSPVNRGSVTFHLRMGFSMESGAKTVDGISVVEDYDGRGEHRVLFLKSLCNRGT